MHNVRCKILTIFMIFKMFSGADLFSRPLCWSNYWWIIFFLFGFEYIEKYLHMVYIATVTGICVGSQGNVRKKSGNFFSAKPVATLIGSGIGLVSSSNKPLPNMLIMIPDGVTGNLWVKYLLDFILKSLTHTDVDILSISQNMFHSIKILSFKEMHF